MARKSLDEIEFRKGTTIGKIKELLAHRDTQTLAEEIHHRFMERFLTPLKSAVKPHGFFIMATCCLLIEAIQRYRQGSPDETVDEKEDLYGNFFHDFPDFNISRAQGKGLYHTLRSGVLHLGETKGWLIWQRGKIIDFDDKTINAKKFRKTLKKCLGDYRDTLKRRKWNSWEWQCVLNRLNGFFKHSDLDYGQQGKK